MTSSVRAEPSATAGRRLRDDPDFRYFWCARTLSSIGSVVTLVALPILVFRLTGSTLLTAVTSACEAAPYMLFGLVAGTLADRWDRRRVMVSADTASMLVVASVPVSYWLGVLSIPQVLAVAFLGPAIGVFFDGANFGAVPLLVGRDRIAQANSAIWGAATTAEMVMPSLVGVSLAVVRPANLLIIDALSFAASATLLRCITRVLHDAGRDKPPLTRRVLLADIAEGLRFLRDHQAVRAMTVVSTIQCLAGGGFVGLMVVWCDRVLQIGTSGWRFGLVYGCWSVGGLVGAFSLPPLLRRTTPAGIVLAATPCSAVLGMTAASAGSWQLAALALLGWSVAWTLAAISSVSYRQQAAPERLVGRVSTAARMIAWGFGWTGGALTSGLIGQLAGVRPAMITLTSLGGIGAAVAWLSPLRSEHLRGSSADQPANSQPLAHGRRRICRERALWEWLRPPAGIAVAERFP